ncbi:MAG: pilus assembly protein PilO [Gammaproteobacteria bacterium SG8_47]|nr:MAG: pilus assembly protein PilO [Gammaproteobacteria bacterium SG8_47]
MKDFDLSSLNELELSDLGNLPVVVKVVLVLLLVAGVGVAGFFLDTKGQLEQLDRVRAEESSLKSEFTKKWAKAANLEAYKKQMAEMKESFGSMLRQLPSKTEVEALLVDISQTGLASGVEFQLFKPEGERFIEFYAEQPIKIAVTGSYHEFGAFVSGVAALPRIVTIHDVDIQSGKGKGNDDLTMNLVAKTYRYLDEDELEAQRAAKKKDQRKKRR